MWDNTYYISNHFYFFLNKKLSPTTDFLLTIPLKMEDSANMMEKNSLLI